MVIQGFKSIGSFTTQYSNPNKLNDQRQDLLPTTKKTDDLLTISDAAKALASFDAGVVAQRKTPMQENLLQSARSDPTTAEKMAYNMANIPTAIVYDITDSLKSGNIADIKLSSTGRKIDDAFKERFNKEAPAIDAKRLAIYKTEMAKGTDMVEIISKMMDFTNSQSGEYLEATALMRKPI